MSDVKKIIENKKEYLDLLLLADPSEEMVDLYLDKGDMFVLYDNGEAVCEAVVYPNSDDECELKNIATAPDRQGRGYGKQLVRYMLEHYKGKYDTMLVGTGNSSKAQDFYKSCGFKYSHTIKDFFVINYPEPIFEDGVQCVDMICFKAALR
jgi:Predicted P-loop ATPase fused to an acetyltransferase